MIPLFYALFLLLIVSCVSCKFSPRTIHRLKLQGTGKCKYAAMNEEQDFYINCMNDPKTGIVISYGPAGTGKTLLACVDAIKKLESGKVNKIILTRPSITVEGEDLGFLPGGLTEKMSPYTQPLFDVFREFYSKDDVTGMITDGIIEVTPLAFMRGRTFKNSIIIADEMQNSTPEQMKMLTTRVGMNSTMIITGDLQQSDLGHRNGLSDLLDRMNSRKTYSGRIKVIDMSSCEVLRSPVASEMIDIYNNVEREEKVSTIVKKSHGSTEKFNFKSSGKIWTKGSDDGRVCSLNGNLDLKICSKCNKSKVRSLYSGMEWENSPSRCNNCMMLGKKMNDNANEEAKERAAILMNIAFDMNVVKEMENIAK